MTDHIDVNSSSYLAAQAKIAKRFAKGTSRKMKTRKGQKRIFYRIKQHNGYLKRDWSNIKDFDTFEDAQTYVEELRNPATYKERPVF